MLLFLKKLGCWYCWYFGCLTSITEDYTKSGGDFKRFNSQKHAQDMHRLRLSTAADECRHLSQCGPQEVDRELTETEDDSVCWQLHVAVNSRSTTCRWQSTGDHCRLNINSLYLSLSTTDKQLSASTGIFKFRVVFLLGFWRAFRFSSSRCGWLNG